MNGTPLPTQSPPSTPSPDTDTRPPRRPPIIIIPPIFPKSSGDPRSDTPSPPPPSPTSTLRPLVPTPPQDNNAPSPTAPQSNPPPLPGNPALPSPPAPAPAPAPAQPAPPIKKQEGPGAIPEITPGMSVVTLPPLTPSPSNESPLQARRRSSNDPLQEAGVEFLSTGTALMMLAGVVLVSAVFAGLAYQAWSATFPPKMSSVFNIRTNPMIYLSGDAFG
ncbi:hypothetical protein BSKO_07879 [Bryopsis sp. KO-2023]|nr:hypothetical protein BSKO_07879 [Bryopsis sp. KO-2023]